LNKNLSKLTLDDSSSFEDAINILNSSTNHIVLIVNKNNKLKGIITKGDLRKAMINYVDKNASVTEVMNKNPFTCTEKNRLNESKLFFNKKDLSHLPVINDKMEVIDVEYRKNKFNIDCEQNIVIIMAGGLGSRLKPLTDDKPKPLLKIGDKPILESIITNCISYGFKIFYISVNYKSEMIKQYFGNGNKWGIKIAYINEEEKLGTAGSLSLLDFIPPKEFLVINADLLTKVDLHEFLSFHLDKKSMGTMAVKDYEIVVPYGVVKSNNGKITEINEKPVQRFFVNAGLYVFDPKVLNLLSKAKNLDMPSFFEMIINKNLKTMIFPILEEWIDIGNFDDYNRAKIKYSGEKL